MKILTNLPYDFNIMNEIKEKGAIVDMSNINYPGINSEDNIRISYIYLRNTNFDVDLDFSKCEYSFKEAFIKFYLEGDIIYNIKEINSTLIKILGIHAHEYFEIKSILDDNEIKTFIENNQPFLTKVSTFIYSLPLYPISRLDFEDTTLDLKDVKHEKGIAINNNICNLIKENLFIELFNDEIQTEAIFYDDIFTENNNELFETLGIYTPFNTLLYGMNQPEEWTQFVDGLEEFIKDNLNHE